MIPFYQVARGLLLRSVRSALSQTARPDGILVVDDGSPSPAEDDLAALSAEERSYIRLIKQDNGGPSTARNRALNELPGDVERIAFLDSDDTWAPDYLEICHLVLDHGFDVSLSNWTTFEAETDAYRRFGHFDSRDFEPIKSFPHVYDACDRLAEMQIRSPLGRLSATVLKKEAIGGVRFDPKLRYACEDRKFILEVAKKGARAAVNVKPACHAGRGINLFSSAKWGTKPSLRIHLDRIRFCRDVARMDLTAPEREALDELRDDVRSTFFLNWAAYVRRHGLDMQPVRDLASLDRGALLHGPIAAAKSYLFHGS